MHHRNPKSDMGTAGRHMDVTAIREREILGESGLPSHIQELLRSSMDTSRLRGDARLEVLAELVSHFQDGLSAGSSPEELLAAFGDGHRLGTEIRRSRPESRWSVRGLGRIGNRLADSTADAFQDIRHALRGLRRSPGFVTVAILTMALGIGANTSVFSVVNGVLLRALPFTDPDQLVVPVLTNHEEYVQQSPVGYADFLRWREETGVFKSMGLFVDWNLCVTDGEYPERVKGAVVSHRFFDVLEAPPVLGRTFSPEEHERGGGRVALLSRGFWERRYGGDPGVIGATIDLDGDSYQIVGVMPPEAGWPREAEIWMPLTFGAVTPDWVLELDARAYSMIARLQPDVELSRGSAVVDQLARRAALERPDTREGFGATLIPLRTHIVGQRTQRALWLLMGCVGFVLLIACANVANLTLDRALGRQREIAVRASIGAGRSRSIRPMAWESILVTVAGGLVGITVAIWATDILRAWAPASLPGLRDLDVDYRLYLFGLLLCLAIGMVFALTPTLSSSRIDLRHALSENGPQAGQGTSGTRVRNMLSVVQLALSVVIVLGATLVVRSTAGLLRADPGFRGENLLTMKVFLPHSPPDSAQNRMTVQVYRSFAENLEALPGAVSASVASALPLSADGLFDHLPFRAEGGLEGPPGEGFFANWNIIGVDFFQTMGVPIVDGRSFTRDDGPTSDGVVIISESFARRLFPGPDPIGKRIQSTSAVVTENWLEVVGVAGDVRYTDLADEGRNVVYVPQAQSAWRAMAIAVRFEGDPESRIDEVREAIWAVDPSVPITQIRTMENVTSESLAASRFASLLVSVFAFLALALAMVGVYGVVNVSLAQRTREMGVRKALGADGREVGRLLLSQGMKLAVLGIGIGLPIGLALARLLSGLLFRVAPHDPGTSVVVVLLLGVMAVGTAALPARRAARIDPVEALRQD